MNWYVTSGGERIGPVSEEQVVEMIRSGTDVAWVRRDGEEGWLNPRENVPFARAIESRGLVPGSEASVYVWIISKPIAAAAWAARA